MLGNADGACRDIPSWIVLYWSILASVSQITDGNVLYPELHGSRHSTYGNLDGTLAANNYDNGSQFHRTRVSCVQARASRHYSIQLWCGYRKWLSRCYANPCQQISLVRLLRKSEEVEIVLDWSPFLRQTVKTHFSLNGELSHGIVTQAVHAGV